MTKEEFLNWADVYCKPTDILTTWRNATVVDIAYNIPFDSDMAEAFRIMVEKGLDKSIFNYART